MSLQPPAPLLHDLLPGVCLLGKRRGEIIRAPWRNNVIIHNALWARHLMWNWEQEPSFLVIERNMKTHSNISVYLDKDLFLSPLNPGIYTLLLSKMPNWLSLMKAEHMTWLCYPYTSNSWVNPSSSHQTWICDVRLEAVIDGWTHEDGMIFLNIHRQITDGGKRKKSRRRKKREENNKQWGRRRKREKNRNYSDCYNLEYVWKSKVT